MDPVVSGHVGPVMSYLGRWQPGQSPQQGQVLQDCRIGVMTRRLVYKVLTIVLTLLIAITGTWGNQMLVKANHTDTMQIPSDIKPGLYIFRTELLALHGTMPALQYTTAGGAQFYPHCFNVEISGSGTATPPGVTIPGAYHQADPGCC